MNDNIDPNMKILVIDDMKTMISIITKMSKKIGFENVSGAHDGVDGTSQLAKAREAGTPFQFILCDWNMPNKSGIEVLKETRSLGDKTPFVMITAENESGNLEQAISNGASGYIGKPFVIGQLEEKINSVLSKS